MQRAIIENPSLAPFQAGIALTVLTALALLHILGMSLAIPALLILASSLLWAAFRYSTPALGTVMALMPIYPLTFLLAQFFGPPYIASLKGCDRVALLLIACILWKRNGVKLIAADWFLLATFGLAIIRFAFGGALINLLFDFSFMIAYAAGRMAPLTADQQKVWARRAVWIITVLSVLGMTEVFVLGPGPRGVLYLAVAPDFTPDGVLDGRFFADSFAGLRECSTMLGPGGFAFLCMIALIFWWIFCRNALPAILIAAGLICTVTRSAWLGTALAIPLLAVIMRQKKRFLVYAALAIALFFASIPVVGLGDYLSKTKSGEEVSAQSHLDTLGVGIPYVASHPFGAGPGNYDRGPADSMRSTSTTSDAPWIESSYLLLASEYGILCSLCFVGFVLAALRSSWQQRTPLGYASLGILVGFGAAMIVAPVHQDFALASWVWFPVGMAIRHSSCVSPRS